jgi:hypothetical protein
MNKGMGHLAHQGECSQQGTGSAGAAVAEVQEPLYRKCRGRCTGSAGAAVPEVQEPLCRKCSSRRTEM